MRINYNKLKHMMVEYKLQLQDIQSNSDISWGTVAKINKEEHINLTCLIKICNYISKVSGKQIKIDDIIDYD